MKKSLLLLSILFSFQTFASLNSGMIPGVSKENFEEALRKEMGVDKVSIVRIEESTFEKMSRMLSDFINSITSHVANVEHIYEMELILDDSSSNSNKHNVRCEIAILRDFQRNKEALVTNCKSKTSTVQNMLFNFREIDRWSRSSPAFMLK